MQNKVIMVCFLLLFCGGKAFAGSTDYKHINAEINISITLADGGGVIGEGGSPDPHLLSFILPPIEATLIINDDTKEVEAEFICELGYVDVIIEDEVGTIYYMQTVNASPADKLTIDVSVLGAGTYTIRFVNEDADLNKTGKFEIE